MVVLKPTPSFHVSEHVVLLRKAIAGYLKKLLLHVRVHDTKATDMFECAGH